MAKCKNKGNIARHTADGKRGFTLTELFVVMALLSILTVMIVSFSVLVNGYAGDSRAVTDHIEDCNAAKTALIHYVRAHDETGALIDPNFSFVDGTLLTADGETLADGLDSLNRITVDQSGKLLTFTLDPAHENFDDFVFVVALRFATIEEGS